MDINGFAEELNSYAKKPHPDKSTEALKSDIKHIFDEFGVNDLNFNVISIAISEGSIKLTSNYIDAFAKNIFKKNMKDRDKEQGKKIEDETLKQEQIAKKSKGVSVCISSENIKNMTIEELVQTLVNKFKIAGLTDSELDTPIKSSTFEHLDSTIETISYKEGTTSREVLKNLAKKMKEQESEKAQDDLFMEETNESKQENTEDKQSRQKENELQNSEPEAENETPAQENEPNEDALTDEDQQLIDDYGIEDVYTHSQMEEFKNSEEYGMIQNMMSNSLSKGDDN